VLDRVARFSWYNIPKRGKIYQCAIQYTSWPQNIPNGSEIDQVAIKIYQHLPLEEPPKFAQIAIFGLKIYHLATLVLEHV
jgi:hypothetical protein